MSTTDCLRCKDLLHFTTSRDVVIHVDGKACEIAADAIGRGSLTTTYALGFAAARLGLPPLRQNDSQGSFLFGNGYADGRNDK